MDVQNIIKVFADNLRALMTQHDLNSGYAVERRTGVSKAQVNNLLAEKNAPTLETVARLSDGFNVPPWALLHDNGVNLYKDQRMTQIIDAFADSSDSGKDVILRVAESQAHYTAD